jgi:hypothetical protein
MSCTVRNRTRADQSVARRYTDPKIVPVSSKILTTSYAQQKYSFRLFTDAFSTEYSVGRKDGRLIGKDLEWRGRDLLEVLYWYFPVCGRALSLDHHTICQHSTPFVLNGRSYAVFSMFRNTFQTLLWFLIAWISPSSLLSWPKKQFAISFLGDVCLNCLGLFGECVCASTALTALWVQHSQMKPRFHHLLLVRCDWEIHQHLCGIALKESKPKPFSVFCEHLWIFSEPILRKTCDNLVENSVWHLWKFTRKFWNCEEPSFALNKIITHYRWPADRFAVHREHLFARPSLNILHHWLKSPFTNYILAVNRAAQFQMYFRSTHVLSVKKADICSNFAAGAIINRRTRNSFCRDRNKH